MKENVLSAGLSPEIQMRDDSIKSLRDRESMI